MDFDEPIPPITHIEAMAHILYHRIKYLSNPQIFHSSKLKHQIRTSALFSEYLNLQIQTNYLKLIFLPGA